MVGLGALSSALAVGWLAVGAEGWAPWPGARTPESATVAVVDETGAARPRGPLRVEAPPADDPNFVHYLDPGWEDDGYFDPIAHDPRRILNSTRRRLEDNKCELEDNICCSLCKNDLKYCKKLAGYLVEDSYYPSEVSVTGSCNDIDKRAGLLDVFGPSKTFRDTEWCQWMVREYVCLWWSTESTAYTNKCKEKGDILVPPCRSYCTQVAIQCANNLEYAELCKKIECPPTEEQCTPGHQEVGQFGCNVYRYNTPAYSGAARTRAIAALLPPVALAAFLTARA